jgi:hypothetical protein
MGVHPIAKIFLVLLPVSTSVHPYKWGVNGQSFKAFLNWIKQLNKGIFLGCLGEIM